MYQDNDEGKDLTGRGYFKGQPYSEGEKVFDVNMDYMAILRPDKSLCVIDLQDESVARESNGYDHVCTTGAASCYALCGTGNNKEGKLVRGIAHLSSLTPLETGKKQMQDHMLAAGVTDVSYLLFAGTSTNEGDIQNFLQSNQDVRRELTTSNQQDIGEEDAKTAANVFMRTNNILVEMEPTSEDQSSQWIPFNFPSRQFTSSPTTILARLTTSLPHTQNQTITTSPPSLFSEDTHSQTSHITQPTPLSSINVELPRPVPVEPKIISNGPDAEAERLLNELNRNAFKP